MLRTRASINGSFASKTFSACEASCGVLLCVIQIVYGFYDISQSIFLIILTMEIVETQVTAKMKVERLKLVFNERLLLSACISNQRINLSSFSLRNHGE